MSQESTFLCLSISIIENKVFERLATKNNDK